MNISSAQYVPDQANNDSIIKVVIDKNSMYVPVDPNNRHYAEILKQVKEGTLTIQDAE